MGCVPEQHELVNVEPTLHLYGWGVLQDFFGGITIFTREQYDMVNGYGTNFWGWGREDDNMRYRLLQHNMFPPELPSVPKRSRHFYFEHRPHEKALEVCSWLTDLHHNTMCMHAVESSGAYTGHAYNRVCII